MVKAPFQIEDVIGVWLIMQHIKHLPYLRANNLLINQNLGSFIYSFTQMIFTECLVSSLTPVFFVSYLPARLKHVFVLYFIDSICLYLFLLTFSVCSTNFYICNIQYSQNRLYINNIDSILMKYINMLYHTHILSEYIIHYVFSIYNIYVYICLLVSTVYDFQ